MTKPQQMTGALSYEEWERLESALFGGAGEALASVRRCARSRRAQPVPFLLSVIQQVLCSLPGNVRFDAGMGPGCLNLYTVLLGAPAPVRTA